jgi:gamma-glutamyltranspeptidase/glutathione hydrolase
VVTNVIDHGQSPQEAVEAPRWFSFPGTDPANLGLPVVVRAEERVPEATRQELVSRGHAVETLGPWAGGGSVQLIQVDQARGVLRGATDPRSGGLAAGL